MLIVVDPALTSIWLVKLGQVSVVTISLFWFVDGLRGSCILGCLVVSFLARVCWWCLYSSAQVIDYLRAGKCCLPGFLND